jgi:predicted dehydrogenase
MDDRKMNRRDFLKASLAAGVGLAAGFSASVRSGALGANSDLRVAVVGFNGHGRTHINSFRELPGARVVALCDVDSNVLERGVGEFKRRGENVVGYTDIRKLLENKDIDVVSTATPNHWHSLVTVLSCQAGKDVCVEKPVSHNIFEGRKMVEAARKYGRIVQAGTESRSDEAIRTAVQYVREGKLGKILLVRGFCHKRRQSMGKVEGPQPVPKSVDYDLWCGPAPLGPLMRRNLHYDWHWVWSTGCGEIGNNGPHQLDICRWVLGADRLPRRIMSIGGRFGYVDDGETANTHIALYDYDPAPIIYEVRGLPARKGEEGMDAYRCVSRLGVKMKSGRDNSPSPNTGVVVQCEHGWVDITGSAAYDNAGKEITRFEGGPGAAQAHDTNFMKAVHSRKINDLNCEILEGHLSTALCHLGNISHRIGVESSPDEIRESIKGNGDLFEAFGRFQEHLAANGVDLKRSPAVLGPWIVLDPEEERFVGDFKNRANKLLSREYRKPFIVPENV